jgi:hypothetical protein
MLDEHESGSNTDVVEHFSVADSRRVAIRQGRQQVRRYTSDPGIVREKKALIPWDERAVAAERGSCGTG